MSTRIQFEGEAPALDWRPTEDVARALLVLEPTDPPTVWIYKYYPGDGFPESIYFGKVPIWSITPYVRGDALRKAIERCAEHLGRLADDPDPETYNAAYEAVEKELADSGILFGHVDNDDWSTVWLAWWARDWLELCSLDECWDRKQPLSQAARNILEDAKAEGVYIIDGEEGIRDVILSKLQEGEREDSDGLDT